MPKMPDNPLRLRRIAAGLSQVELARRSSLARSSIVAIEEGRTEVLKPDTARALALALGVAPVALEHDLAAWHAARASNPASVYAALPVAAQKALLLSPDEVGRIFRSFREWRSVIAPSSTSFASIVGLSRNVVAFYEEGRRRRPGMPEVLQRAIVERLDVPVEYVLALEKLQVGS